MEGRNQTRLCQTFEMHWAGHHKAAQEQPTNEDPHRTRRSQTLRTLELSYAQDRIGLNCFDRRALRHRELVLDAVLATPCSNMQDWGQRGRSGFPKAAVDAVMQDLGVVAQQIW